MIKKPMLAENAEDISAIKFPVACTPKLDGIRCLKINGQALSRKFKAIPNRYIREMLEQQCPDGLDGELMIKNANFNSVQSGVMSEDGKPDFEYWVFDYVDASGLHTPYMNRMEGLGRLALPPFCKKVLPWIANSVDELNRIEAQWLAQGFEGVMMRSPHSFAMAVRRPNGEIVVKEDAWRSIWERARFLRRPFLRGAVVLFESMHNGMKALSFSANEAAKALEGQADGEAAGAGDKPAKQSDWAIARTLALSAIVGFALFGALPHFLTWLAGHLLGNAAMASGKALGFQVVDGLVKMLFLLGYLWAISRMKDIQRVFQYHGAEHKSIYCYEAGQPLTVENARAFTRLHPRCGTTFVVMVALVSVVLFSLIGSLLPEILREPGPIALIEIGRAHV